MMIDRHCSSARAWVAVAVMLIFATIASPGRAQVHPPADDVDPAVVEFAREFEVAVSSNDRARIRAAFDIEALARRAYRLVRTDDVNEDAFVRGVTQGFRMDSQFVDAGVVLRLLRVVREEDGHRALYRAMIGDGLNYYECIIRSHEDGLPRIVDMYIMMRGEEISRTAARLSMRILDVGVDDPAFRQLERLQQAVFEARAEDAMDIYAAMPQWLQHDKTVMLLRISVAAEIGDEAIVEAGDAFVRLFPDDPALEIVMVDSYFVRQEWDRAQASLDRINRFVGPDGYVIALMGVAHLLAGDRDAAVDAFRKSIAVEPDLDVAYWRLVEIHLENREFERVAELLTMLVHECGVEFENFRDIPAYEAFVASGVYDRWLGDVVRHDPLQTNHVEHLAQLRILGRLVFAHYAPPEPDGTPTQSPSSAEAIDRVFAMYMADEAEEQPQPLEVANGLGALAGDVLRDALGMEWIVYTDASINGVYALRHVGTDIIAQPFDEIINAVRAGRSSFALALIESTRRRIETAKEAAGERD